MALFGEKYGDTVSEIAHQWAMKIFLLNFVVEPMLERLGDIGRFKIISESGISAGIRRIEAITGIEAYELDKKNENEPINQIVNLNKIKYI